MRQTGAVKIYSIKATRFCLF